MEIALLDKVEVCRFFGGSRPLHPASLYRGIKLGRYPRPVHIGGSSRWVRRECDEALSKMVEARHG
jgi:predicted DNA-binding transcriptional regulator AlpA